MRNLAIAAAALSLTTPAFAGAIPDFIGFSGSYAQNFDTLPLVDPSGSIGTAQVGFGPHLINTGFGIGTLPGWFGANSGGTASNTEFKAHNGSRFGSDGRGVISFGVNDSTDRSLGALATSNQINTFGLVLRNETTSAVDALDLAFAGQQWRRGDRLASNAFVNTLRLTYSVFSSNPGLTVVDDLFAANPNYPAAPQNPPSFTTSTALSFTSPDRTSPINSALNGNDPANSVALASQLSSLNWAPGSYLVVRWTITESSGQDDGLGIDDLLVSLPNTNPSFVLGDFNFDGGVDASDIDPFVIAANEGDPFAGYIAQFNSAFVALYPGETLTADVINSIGDFNGDGGVDASDIDPFVVFANNGGATVSAIPEPAALGLLAPLGLLISRRRR